MKLTLLDIVVDVLSDMDSDEVNSIGDTVESLQVAQIAKSSFYSMIATRNWPHLKKLIELTPSGNLSLPTHMYLDDKCKELLTLNYNKAKSTDTRLMFGEVKYLENDAFLRRLNSRNSNNQNVKTVTDPSGIELLILNDQAPQYFTSFDQKTIVFDSYDEAVDDTLRASKIQAFGYITPSWEMSDDFIPDLPMEAFPALLANVKSASMIRLKQTVDNKAEADFQHQQRWLSRKAYSVRPNDIYPHRIGRRPRK